MVSLDFHDNPRSYHEFLCVFFFFYITNLRGDNNNSNNNNMT